MAPTTDQNNRAKLAEPPPGLLLTPGASADRDHPTLVAIEAGLPEISVERLTLGTTSVKSAVGKITVAAEQLAEQLDVAPGRLALGGRSFGGRSCSVAVAEGLPACALILLSYPLHPPGKPDKLRVDHFPNIDVATLFVSGEKDPFGRADEFASHIGSIPGDVAFEQVTGNHSPKGQDDTIVALLRSFFGLD